MNPSEHLQYLLRRLRERLREQPTAGPTTDGSWRMVDEQRDSPASDVTPRPSTINHQPPSVDSSTSGLAARLSGLRAASRALQQPAELPAAPDRSSSLIPHPSSSPSLSDLIPGEVLQRAEGQLYRVRRRTADLCGDTTDLVRRYGDVFRRLGGSGTPLILLRSPSSCFAVPHLPPGEFAALRRTTPDRVLFLDIETTGLMSTPLFLIGLGSLIEGDFVMTQLLARDYAEEAAVLANFRENLTRYDVLVTFNGKSFDVRYIRDRLIYHRLPSAISHPHVDLLPPARRRWRGHFENCRLQTLEARVCGRTRTDDIPSAEIPQAYHDFVRTGNPHLLERILYHNAMDLVTMVELLVALVEV
jgi:uncharacterized protein YprB with RNaseH-like and TPR domain